MEQKVWMNTSLGVQYPNLYVVLTGPAGVGKSILINLVAQLWGKLPKQFIASDSVSVQSLVDELREASRNEIRPEGPVNFNSLKIAQDELGVLLSSYEPTFMNTLQKLYDSSRFAERKRTRELKYVIERAQLHILSGCTPDFLKNFMPEGAWEQGFASRTHFIYSGDMNVQDIFDSSRELDQKLLDDLLHDLKIIGELWGKVKFAEEATAAIKTWHLKKGEPRPDHPKLAGYLTRRTAHLIRLCMIASASRSNDLIVTVDDYARALSWLVEAETFMPDIFRAMASGGDSNVIKETWYYIYKLWMKEQRPVFEGRLYEFIALRTPAHNIPRVLDVMVKMRLLEQRLESVGTCYIPKKPLEEEKMRR